MKKIEFALTKEACKLCGKTQDNTIIFNTDLNDKTAKKVKELDSKTIGYMEEPCKECQEYINKGFLLIGIIEEKTENNNNPFRSGNIWVVSKDYANKVFKDTSKGAAFIDIKLAKKLNLPFNTKKE